MSSYAPALGPFAYSYAPVHGTCYLQQPPAAACLGQVSAAHKSSIGTAFDTAASSGGATHALRALERLALEYVCSLASKYTTLQRNRAQEAATSDHDSRHLLLQRELALLHEIIDIKHDMQILERKYAENQEVVSASRAIADALAPLL